MKESRLLDAAKCLFSVASLTLLAGCHNPHGARITENDLLTQSGEVNFLGYHGDQYKSLAETFYPIPYESPPQLMFPEAEHGKLVELEQDPTGFSVKTYSQQGRGSILKWEAIGVPQRRNSLFESDHNR